MQIKSKIIDLEGTIVNTAKSLIPTLPNACKENIFEINSKLQMHSMTYKKKSINWYVQHPLTFAIFRILLGMVLALRGINFFVNVKPLYYLIKDTRLNEMDINMSLAMTISFIHIFGGVLITLGLFTKLAAWGQVPILLGAIIFVNSNNTLSLTYPGLLFTLFVLVFLLIFAIKGGGRYSFENYTKRHLL